MYPVLSVGSWRLNVYPLMLGLAALVLGFGSWYRMHRRGLALAGSVYDLVDFMFWLLVGAFAGGKAAGVLPEAVPCVVEANDCRGWWQAGIHWMGFVGGGAAVAYVYLGRRRLRRGPTFDAVAPMVPLALTIARVGCLCAGCCYGRVNTARQAMVLPDVDGLWARRYPTRIASMAANLLIMVVLLVFERWTAKIRRGGRGWPFPGFLFLLYVELYAIQRFYFEFWRADMPSLFGPFTWTHLYCAAAIVIATGLMAHGLLRRRKGHGA